MLAIGSGLLMGLTAAAISGAALVWLLRSQPNEVRESRPVAAVVGRPAY
jgi:hypothetical protein